MESTAFQNSPVARDRDQGEVHSQLDRCQSLVENLQALTQELEARLNPVTTPTDSAKELSGHPRPIASGVASRLMDQAEGLEIVARDIRQVLDRLEV